MKTYEELQRERLVNNFKSNMFFGVLNLVIAIAMVIAFGWQSGINILPSVFHFSMAVYKAYMLEPEEVSKLFANIWSWINKRYLRIIIGIGVVYFGYYFLIVLPKI